MCPKCPTVDEIVETILTQSQIDKIQLRRANQEKVIDFAGPFQNAIEVMNWMIVLLDQYTGWPLTKFRRNQEPRKRLNFERTR